MSQENVELLRSAHDAFNSGDRERFVDLWHPDCEYRPALEGAIEGQGGVYRGHEGIRQWWEQFHDEWEDFSTDIEVHDLGDRTLTLGVLRARGRMSGVALEAPIAQLTTFRAGKVMTGEDYFDRDAALKAAGLSEQDVRTDAS
jgi:ketosteroid isomerase-like protein